LRLTERRTKSSYQILEIHFQTFTLKSAVMLMLMMISNKCYSGQIIWFECPKEFFHLWLLAGCSNWWSWWSGCCFDSD